MNPTPGLLPSGSSQVTQEPSSSLSRIQATTSPPSLPKTKSLPSPSHLSQLLPQTNKTVKFKMTTLTPKIQPIATSRVDTYHDKVVYTYDDPPPTMWHKALGEDNLSFQLGLFSEAELTTGPTPGPVGPSEFRHFDRQLELSGLLARDPLQNPVKRILDLGCG